MWENKTPNQICPPFAQTGATNTELSFLCPPLPCKDTHTDMHPITEEGTQNTLCYILSSSHNITKKRRRASASNFTAVKTTRVLPFLSWLVAPCGSPAPPPAHVFNRSRGRMWGCGDGTTPSAATQGASTSRKRKAKVKRFFVSKWELQHAQFLTSSCLTMNTEKTTEI